MIDVDPEPTQQRRQQRRVGYCERAPVAGRDVSPRAIRPSEDLDRAASPVKLRMMHLSNRLAGLQDELDAEKKVWPL